MRRMEIKGKPAQKINPHGTPGKIEAGDLKGTAKGFYNAQVDTAEFALRLSGPG